MSNFSSAETVQLPWRSSCSLRTLPIPTGSFLEGGGGGVAIQNRKQILLLQEEGPKFEKNNFS